MNSVQIAPRVWLNDGIFYGSNESSTDEPLYDQSAIDRLTADCNDIRALLGALQIRHRDVMAERDAAAAELARVKASVGAIHYGVLAGFSPESILVECVHAAPELAAIDAARAEGDA